MGSLASTGVGETPANLDPGGRITRPSIKRATLRAVTVADFVRPSADSDAAVRDVRAEETAVRPDAAADVDADVVTQAPRARAKIAVFSSADLTAVGRSRGALRFPV